MEAKPLEPGSRWEKQYTPSARIKEEWYQVIRQVPGIELSPEKQAMASPEAQTVVNLPSVESPINISDQTSIDLRPRRSP